MKVEEYCNDDYVVDIKLSKADLKKLQNGECHIINTIKCETLICIGIEKEKGNE